MPYDRAYTIKFHASSDLLRRIQAKRLNQGTPFEEKDMPFLNRLLAHLAQAIAEGTAPPSPSSIVLGSSKNDRCFWFRPKDAAIRNLIEEQESDRTKSIQTLLYWATLLPSPPRILSRRQLHRILLKRYGRKGKLLKQFLPSLKEMHRQLGDRLTKEALKTWLSEILSDQFTPSCRKLTVTTLRTVLHRKKSFLTIDGFSDGADHPVSIQYFSKPLALLVPTVAVNKLVRSRGLMVETIEISDYGKATAWGHKLKALASEMQSGKLDIAHFLLKDRRTKVSLVSERLIEFGQQEMLTS